MILVRTPSRSDGEALEGSESDGPTTAGRSKAHRGAPGRRRSDVFSLGWREALLIGADRCVDRRSEGHACFVAPFAALAPSVLPGSGSIRTTLA